MGRRSCMYSTDNYYRCKAHIQIHHTAASTLHQLLYCSWAGGRCMWETGARSHRFWKIDIDLCCAWSVAMTQHDAHLLC